MMQYKQTGKRKSRSNSHEQYLQRTLPAGRGAGLKKASAPDDFESYQAKRRLSIRANLDEERKAMTKMTMELHLKFFGKQVRTQSEVLTCASQTDSWTTHQWHQVGV